MVWGNIKFYVEKRYITLLKAYFDKDFLRQGKNSFHLSLLKS